MKIRQVKMRDDDRSVSVGRSMSPNFRASFDDLAQCYDPHPPQPQQHHIGVMQAASMEPQPQCYPSADQTRNSNPDMLDTYGHQSLHFGGAAAHHHQGSDSAVPVCSGGDMPNGFHALGELVEMPIDRSILDRPMSR